MPTAVTMKDMDPAMDATSLSRLVRDLCRQHDYDRVAWQESVSAVADHAQRLDTLEHEALQTNDQFSLLMDGHLFVQKASEKQFKEHIQAAVNDLTAGIRLTDATMRQHVDTGLANSKVLLSELTAKFEQLGAEMNAMKHATAGAAATAAAVAAATAATAAAGPATQNAVPTRAPFLDPVTGLQT